MPRQSGKHMSTGGRHAMAARCRAVTPTPARSRPSRHTTIPRIPLYWRTFARLVAAAVPDIREVNALQGDMCRAAMRRV
ncbi:hypothetical protein HMPREF3196_02061 [Bifidobacterium bifidum]|uniref:Uncharacterized protein n=1 Tax=Bifidobacterium bifidum TaxID=1681 RepID=A0A133KKE5_BIFBI|nr:hypothetical protein HMPREF3196_02061 [Bifidobacterium bifidum]